jgi:hypothetical protein
LNYSKFPNRWKILPNGPMGPTQYFEKLLSRGKEKKKSLSGSKCSKSQRESLTPIAESERGEKEKAKQDKRNQSTKVPTHGQLLEELFPGGRTLGINILYSPPSALKPVADIVIIHGLKGHSFTTWLETRSGTYWPAHLLPQDVPNARIMTFGYDADPLGMLVSGQNDIRDHAHTLLGDLARERKGDPVRKLLVDIYPHVLTGSREASGTCVYSTQPWWLDHQESSVHV